MVLSALHKGLGSGKPRRRHRLPLLTSLLLCLCLATGCMAMPAAQTSGTETAETTSPSESPMEEGQAQGEMQTSLPDDEEAPEDGQAQPVQTEDDGLTVGAFYLANVREFLSLRASNSSSATCMEEIGPGESLMLLESVGNFARVITKDGSVGYVMSDYLALGGEAFDWPKREKGVHTVVCREYVSLRTEPDVKAERIDTLATYEQVEVLGYENRFAHVRWGDEEGYVLAEYLNKGTYQAPSSQEAEEPAQSEQPEQEQESQASTWTASCEEYLTLRSEASLSAESLGRVPAGAKLSVLGYSGLFAQVRYEGQEGYVLSGYLTSQEDKGLSIVKAQENYGYDQLMEDAEALAERYPSLHVSSIGQSAEGREIPVLVIGDEGANTQVLLQYAIHGREHMTALLAMAQVEYLLAHPEAELGEETVAQTLEDVCLHFVPMLNPDGVCISQEEEAQWKANARGVDLNRNFNAGWESLDGAKEPGAERYKGESPESEPETQAIVRYVEERQWDATVSYHAYGSLIYWHYGDDEEVNALSRDLGRAVRSQTGYPLDSGEGVDSGGFKDWAMDELGIPSLTVEVGTRSCPLPEDEFDSIFERNKLVPAAVARWARAKAMA